MSTKIVYKDLAVGADTDAAVTAGSASEVSTPALLPFGGDTADRIMTGELNGCPLDGAGKLLDGQAVAYWSSALSGADGTFTAAPSISVAFDSQYTSLGIYLLFAADNCCSGVTITWYRSGAQLDTADFTPAGAEYFCSRTVTAYDRVDIAFTATALPYRRVKLRQILFGLVRTFYPDELRDTSLLQEADLLSDELIVNTLDWTLDSADAIDYVFQLKQPVEAYNGSTLLGVFFIDSAVRRGSRVYDISCIDAIGVLDQSDFGGGMYSAKSAATLLSEIVNGAFELDVDASFSAATVTGYLPQSTRRAALQQVCFAVGAIADTSGSGKIRVFPAAAGTAAPIPQDRTYYGGAVTTDPIVTAATVLAHTYTQGGTQTAGDDIVEVGGVKYKHTTAETTIANPAVTAADKANVIRVENATLVSPANVAAAAQRVYNYYARRTAETVQIVLAGEKCGDYVSVQTPYGTTLTGHITSLRTVLSGIAAADAEIRGT